MSEELMKRLDAEILSLSSQKERILRLLRDRVGQRNMLLRREQLIARYPKIRPSDVADLRILLSEQLEKPEAQVAKPGVISVNLSAQP